MHYQLAFAAAILLAIGAPALAKDRPVTDEERAKLVAAVAAQGCSGGKMEFDDGHFEVDDAKCNDGREYDLEFDIAFNLIKKKVDD
jgi:hypothetical protein